MSVLKAAVKRLFLFVPNSFPIYAVDFLSNIFIIKELYRVVKLCLQTSFNLDVRPSTGR